MPAMVADTQDRFTELFGTRRGADRPEEELNAEQESIASPCAGGCGSQIETSEANQLGPDMPFHYCAPCLPIARSFLARAEAVNKKDATIDITAKRAAAEPKRAEKTRRRRAYRAAKWRFRKCYFSRPFGHVFVLMENPPIMVRGRAYECAGCGKFQGKDG